MIITYLIHKNQDLAIVSHTNHRKKVQNPKVGKSAFFGLEKSQIRVGILHRNVAQ